MKAVPFEEKRLMKWEPPYICQPKYDGIRCRAIPTGSGTILLSSEENVIYSVPHINEMFDNMKLDCELDGELYSHNLPFEELVSRTNRTANLHPDREQVSFYLFDVVNDRPQSERILWIKNYVESDHLKIAPFWICYSLDEIMKVYDNIVSNNYEGIIVRHYLAPYVRKRSTFVMKFKPKQEDSYEIVGFQEEVSKDGNPKDTLGALVCKSGDGNLFHVGTGFTEERRREIWEARDILEGQFAKVKYQHITVGKKVPRFPVFVEVEVRP